MCALTFFFPMQRFVLQLVLLDLSALLLILAHVRKNRDILMCALTFFFPMHAAVCTTACLAGFECTAPDTCSREEK